MASIPCHCKQQPIILIHGGADDIPLSMYSPKKEGIKRSVLSGYKTLINGGSSLDAVETAIRIMEDDEYFNCGRGSMLNAIGEAEMDSSIMNGYNLEAGAVAGVKYIEHPVSLARLVMEKTPHVSLIGEGAIKFAKEQNIPQVSNESLVTEFALSELEEARKTGYQNVVEGTVGAVAIDKNGHMAAATSTGGLPFKMVGRMGDSCIIGSGTYADDNVGAVSVTGHGESIAKLCVAHNIIKEMEFGSDPNSALKKTFDIMKSRLKRTAGAIVLSKNGEIGIQFITTVMPWAYIKNNELHYGLEADEHITENMSVEQ